MSNSKVKAFCSSCCRPEWHKPRPVNLLVGAVALTVTLGGAALLRPYRCVCCGTTRFGVGKKPAKAA